MPVVTRRCLFNQLGWGGHGCRRAGFAFYDHASIHGRAAEQSHLIAGRGSGIAGLAQDIVAACAAKTVGLGEAGPPGQARARAVDGFARCLFIQVECFPEGGASRKRESEGAKH